MPSEPLSGLLIGGGALWAGEIEFLMANLFSSGGIDELAVIGVPVLID
jgi:hypothetical protein